MIVKPSLKTLSGWKFARGRARADHWVFGVGAILFIAGLALTSFGSMTVLDALAYDPLVAARTRPRPDTVVIVAIDRSSIEQLGQWPWPRRIHTQLVERLAGVGVKAIGFDVLFQAPAQPEEDAQFARAIMANGRVALAVAAPVETAASSRPAAILPIPILERAAAQLGHVEFITDRDGVTRSVALRAGVQIPAFPALAAAVLNVANEAGGRPAGGGRFVPAENATGSSWMQSTPLLIGFSGGPGHITRISYADVLNDDEHARALRDKLVLVGPVGIDRQDRHLTPTGPRGTYMSGTEVHANVLAALQRGRMIQPLAWPVHALVILFASALLGLAAGRLRAPHAMVLTAVGVVLAMLAISFVLLHGANRWMPPTVPVLLAALATLLWFWHRLSQTRRSLNAVRDHAAVTLRSIGDAVVTTDRTGAILQLNRAARRLLALSEHEARGQHLAAILESPSAQSRGSIERAVRTSVRTGLPVQVPEPIQVIRAGRQTTVRLSTHPVSSIPRDRRARVVVTLNDLSRAGAPAVSIAHSVAPRDTPNTPVSLEPHAALTGRTALEPHDTTSRDATARRWTRSDLELERALRTAIDGNELQLRYQPQVSLASGRLIGVEALVRWLHPRDGMLPPTRFIPIAEASSLIDRIGQWVLRHACLQAAAWHRAGFTGLQVAVNLSPRQFAQEHAVAVIRGCLRETRVDPTTITLELAENMVMRDGAQVSRTLRALKNEGVRLSVDDLGTGYTSISHLKRSPIDEFKIDQSFVRGITTSADDAAIAETLLGIGRSLGISVIAAGVETREQLAFLRTHGCDRMQGYFFGRPLPAAEVEALAEGDVIRRLVGLSDRRRTFG